MVTQVRLTPAMLGLTGATRTTFSSAGSELPYSARKHAFGLGTCDFALPANH
jgi:hypothetical protein